jgi:hypothetical protein
MVCPSTVILYLLLALTATPIIALMITTNVPVVLRGS